MRTRLTILVAVAIAGVSLFAKTVLAQSTKIEAQMDLVVKLRVRFTPQSTMETAAGMLVGKDSQNAYFITACHAIIKEGIAAQSVELEFHSSPQKIKATVFERFEPDLDLAVVEVPVTSLPNGLPETVRKDAALMVPIHVIGHPSSGDWSVATGTVQNLAPGGKIHKFSTSRDNALSEGDSGGPVFDAQGAFLGIHTASAPKSGIEAKSGEILSQLAAWRVPTNNITTVEAAQPNGGVVGQQADRDAVARVIDAYVDSYNHKDAKALWKIWPDAPDKTKQAIKSYFDSAQSIAMKVTDLRVETNGTNATVMGQSSQEFKPRNGSTLKSPESPITIELEKRNGTWLITFVR
jgi:S1-C subfamily serine protease